MPRTFVIKKTFYIEYIYILSPSLHILHTLHKHHETQFPNYFNRHPRRSSSNINDKSCQTLK